MRAGSLRLRLVAGGLLAILLALTVAGGGLVVLFERHVSRSLADDLEVHLNQLLAAIDVDPQGRLMLVREPADPRFANPLSGLYWQVSDDRGQLLRSRSLWDSTLVLPTDSPPPGQVHQHETPGPGNARVLVAERQASLTVGDRRVAVRLAVGTDLARVSRATAAFARDLAIALGILGLVLAGATAVQVSLGLRPLDRLRRDIAEIRAGRSNHLPTGVPLELQPLAEELNGLLDGQEREIERSRGRAADLAHGLKTPLAALAGDARRLRQDGQEAIARDIEEVVDSMSRHVDRELARTRVRATARGRAGWSTAAGPLLRSLIAALARTHDGARIGFECEGVDGLSLAMDRTDLAEVLGNLLDNASRHAASRVRIVGRNDGPSLTIEDDGPGIAPEALGRVVGRGVRLDQRASGTGLGLAIVQDVLEAYGWSFALGASEELGGLKVTIRPT